MKRNILLLIISLFALSVMAQEGTLTWHTDINKAIEISSKEKKPLMLFFTGSDWCGWCIRLQNEVFKKEEFISWASKNVVLVELDFPRRKQLEPQLQQQNNHLQQIFQVRGYPTVWFVTPQTQDGKTNLQQLGRTGYVAGGPVKWLEAVKPFVKS